MDHVEAIIVGAGVVGLAIARQLSQQLPNVLVVDQHADIGQETSSRNSEVIHAGLYYPTESLKAKYCVAGKQKLYDYCLSRNIPHQQLGKLLVAQSEDEIHYLERLLQVANNNGVNDLQWLSKQQLMLCEPQVSAKLALSSPSTGIIDVHSYMQSLLADVELNQGMFVGKTKVLTVEPSNIGFKVKLDSQGQHSQLTCRYLINAAGLHATTLAKNIANLSALHIPKLNYCRGHYFSYQGKSPFKRLIYPIPSANGLGIHASLDIGGQLKFGPDTQYVDELTYEVSPDLKDKFVKAITAYFPSLEPHRLQPAYAGIRPKLQGENDGFKDFVIQGEAVHGIKGLVNLFGIDSPGLTSSLAIADNVMSQIFV